MQKLFYIQAPAVLKFMLNSWLILHLIYIDL